MASPEGACTKAKPKPQAPCPSVPAWWLCKDDRALQRERRGSHGARPGSANPPCTSGRGKVEDFPLRGRGAVRKARPRAAAYPLPRTMHPSRAPSPCSGVGGSARDTPGSKPPLPGTPGVRVAATARHGRQQMGCGRGRERATVGRGWPLAPAFGGSGGWLRFQLSDPQPAPIFHFVSLAAGAAAGLPARGTACPARSCTVPSSPWSPGPIAAAMG